jgi:hypothetical protein
MEDKESEKAKSLAQVLSQKSKSLDCDLCLTTVGGVCEQFMEDKESEKAKSFARVLFDAALLESGFQVEKPKEFNVRLYDILADAYGIERDLSTPVEPEVDDFLEVCCHPKKRKRQREKWVWVCQREREREMETKILLKGAAYSLFATVLTLLLEVLLLALTEDGSAQFPVLRKHCIFVLAASLLTHVSNQIWCVPRVKPYH